MKTKIKLEMELFKKQAVKNEIMPAEHANQGDWVRRELLKVHIMPHWIYVLYILYNIHYKCIIFIWKTVDRQEKRCIWHRQVAAEKNSSLQTLCEYPLKIDK